MSDKNVLFLCVANSARSQMAEGLLRAARREGLRVFSAGSTPSSVNPFAVRAMHEIGIDIRSHRSKSVQEFSDTTIDAVVTLCAEEVCPVFLGAAHRHHWPIEDPASADRSLSDSELLSRFRRARDEIQRRIESESFD